MNAEIQATRVVWTLSICTALALLGDGTMYAVLPSQYALMGLASLHVGWLLSINRLVRLPLNMVSGWLSDRLGAKGPYALGLALGACSTVGYGLSNGFWPLLIFRTLWGVAWALLAVAAYKMILEVTTERNRGRFLGIYTLGSFFGGLGTVLGSFLVDQLGFSTAMLILGVLTSAGSVGALTLPPTRSVMQYSQKAGMGAVYGLGMHLQPLWEVLRQFDARVLAISALNFAHRFFFAGVLYGTFGLYLRSLVGERVRLGPLVIGVASLTAILLFARSVLRVMTGVGAGYLSDRLGDRSPLLLLGEVLGMVGLSCFALGSSSLLLGAGVLLAATAYGLVPPLVMAWLGDLSRAERHGRTVGIYQTMGDLGSGIGPLVGYGLLEFLGIRWVYGVSAGFLALTIPLILRARRWR